MLTRSCRRKSTTIAARLKLRMIQQCPSAFSHCAQGTHVNSLNRWTKTLGLDPIAFQHVPSEHATRSCPSLSRSSRALFCTKAVGHDASGNIGFTPRTRKIRKLTQSVPEECISQARSLKSWRGLSGISSYHGSIASANSARVNTLTRQADLTKMPWL